MQYNIRYDNTELLLVFQIDRYTLGQSTNTYRTVILLVSGAAANLFAFWPRVINIRPATRGTIFRA